MCTFIQVPTDQSSASERLPSLVSCKCKIFMAINYLLIDTLGFLYISSSGSANTQLPGCFCPWTFSLNIGLNMFPLDSFMPCLHSPLGHSTGEFQALQLIVRPCGVWCRGLTTCPLYVSTLFGNLV